MNVLRSLLMVCALAVVAGSARADGLRILAATNDLGAFAHAAGGELVEIDVVARPDRDLHTLEIRPSAMRRAARADVYLTVGLSLDLWSRGVVDGSRNRDLEVIDCSDFVEILGVPTGAVSARDGDVHPEGNPHYFVDPVNAVSIVRRLAARFATLDPGNAGAFSGNAEAFAAEVERRSPMWRALLEDARIVTYHDEWLYLAHRFGMTIIGTVEPKPGIPPSGSQLATLIEHVRERDARVVLRQPYHPGAPVELLARETGVRDVVLPVSCAKATADAYLSHLDAVSEVIGGAAREAF